MLTYPEAVPNVGRGWVVQFEAWRWPIVLWGQQGVGAVPDGGQAVLAGDLELGILNIDAVVEVTKLVGVSRHKAVGCHRRGVKHCNIHIGYINGEPVNKQA